MPHQPHNPWRLITQQRLTSDYSLLRCAELAPPVLAALATPTALLLLSTPRDRAVTALRGTNGARHIQAAPSTTSVSPDTKLQRNIDGISVQLPLKVFVKESVKGCRARSDVWLKRQLQCMLVKHCMRIWVGWQCESTLQKAAQSTLILSSWYRY